MKNLSESSDKRKNIPEAGASAEGPAEAFMEWEELPEAENDPEDSGADRYYYERLAGKRDRRRKEKKRTRVRNLLMIVIPVLLTVLLFFLVSAFVDGQKWVTVGARGHQYYNGSEVTVYEDTKLRKDGNGKTVSRWKEEESIADLPIYYDDIRAMMITEDMDYYDPRSGLLRKADAFTEVAEKANGRLRASLKDAETELDRGFLYNGRNLYLLLEPAALSVNGCTLDLPAFSYVETEGGSVSVFNYETKETERIAAETEALAVPEAGGYELQMLGTMLEKADGTLQLLFFEPAQLESLFKTEKE